MYLTANIHYFFWLQGRALLAKMIALKPPEKLMTHLGRAHLLHNDNLQISSNGQIDLPQIPADQCKL